MNNSGEECYVFLKLCENDFRMALKSYSCIADQEFGYHQLVYLRDAAVCYARPFSGNRGIYSKRLSLGSEFVPKRFLELHEEIIRLRGTLFAHSDVEERNPTRCKLGDGEDEIFIIESDGIYLSDVKEKLKDMDTLINEIQQSVGSRRKVLGDNL